MLERLSLLRKCIAGSIDVTFIFDEIFIFYEIFIIDVTFIFDVFIWVAIINAKFQIRQRHYHQCSKLQKFNSANAANNLT